MHYFCIPYRDSEFSGGKYKRALEKFKPYFKEYLECNNYNYKVLYVEQTQDNRLFNMGKLNNIGFDLSCKYLSAQDSDTYAHHPVDRLPTNVNYNFDGDCCFIFDGRRDAPKVHMYRGITFKKVNGYSNTYEGWGHEDSDMYERLRIKNITVPHTQYNFQELACNGTGITDGSGNYSPKYEDGWAILKKLQESKDIFYSGLNTLTYKLQEFKETDINEYHALVDIY
jgi:predicted glycosyltransferase involved in capsule biosynthesis